MGGAMGQVTDETLLQIRMLNVGTGPGGPGPARSVRQAALPPGHEARPGVAAQPGPAPGHGGEHLPPERRSDAPRRAGRGPRLGVTTATGAVYAGRAVVVTAGTFLNGRIITGESIQPAGRAGEFPAVGLSASLRELGFTLERLKTGTPPRLDARTVDFAKTVIQPGSDVPLAFRFDPDLRPLEPAQTRSVLCLPGPHTQRPGGGSFPATWCAPRSATHALIRANLHRAPMYSGVIVGRGPRYCPSIEAKVVRLRRQALAPDVPGARGLADQRALPAGRQHQPAGGRPGGDAAHHPRPGARPHDPRGLRRGVRLRALPGRSPRGWRQSAFPASSWRARSTARPATRRRPPRASWPASTPRSRSPGGRRCILRRDQAYIGVHDRRSGHPRAGRAVPALHLPRRVPAAPAPGQRRPAADAAGSRVGSGERRSAWRPWKTGGRPSPASWRAWQPSG